MYADDILSFSDTVIGLQKQIDSISEYSKQIGMSIIVEKTKTLVFRKGGVMKNNERWFVNRSCLF